MEKTIFLYRFFELFLRYFIMIQSKFRKIAHDLSEHGIPYPALLFGPTNRAVFLSTEDAARACRANSEPSSAGKTAAAL